MSFESDTDTRIAAAMTLVETAADTVSRTLHDVRRFSGQTAKYTGKGRYEYSGTVEEALAGAPEWALAKYTEAQAKLEAARAELAEARSLYTGWSRFFLVTNTNGHIHKDLNCHTCTATTTYNWVTSLSGQTEAEAVAELGEILCSVCFPSAPVAWSTGVAKATQKARDEREAKKAAAAAKKAEKALLPDGSDLVFKRTGSTYTERIGTLAAAKMYLTDVAQHRLFGYNNLDVDGEALVAEAVAAKTGETVAEVLAAAAKRAAKR